MFQAYHLCGGAPVLKKVKVGASFPLVGIPAIDGTSGTIPATVTDGADCWGLAIEAATYSTVQGAVEALVTIDVRPDLVIRSLVSGGAGTGTALTLTTTTAASSGGTVVTSASVGTASLVTGTIWCIKGANVGLSRVITAWSSGVSATVTVPFPYGIAIGDQFLWVPFNASDVGVGAGNVQATTALTQVDGSIVAGTGLVVAVCDLELGGRTDTNVLFLMADHAFGTATL